MFTTIRVKISARKPDGVSGLDLEVQPRIKLSSPEAIDAAVASLELHLRHAICEWTDRSNVASKIWMRQTEDEHHE